MCYIKLDWTRVARDVLCVVIAFVAFGRSTCGWAQSNAFIDEPSGAFIYYMLANVATQATVDPFSGFGYGENRALGYYADNGYYRGQSAENGRFNGVFDREFTDGWTGVSAQTNYATSSSAPSNYHKHAWISPSYSQFVVKGRGAEPGDRTNMELKDFRATRTGGEFGFYWSTLDERSSFGFLGSYAQGRMTQALRNNPYHGYEDERRLIRYELNDVQDVRGSLNYTDCTFGVNLKHEFYNGVRVEGVVLGGVQDYGLQRYVAMNWDGLLVDAYWTPEQLLDPTIPYYAKYSPQSGEYRGHFSGNLNGNTLSAMIRLTRDFDLGANWSWSPIAEVVSAHSWLYKSVETGYDLIEWLEERWADVDVYPTTGFMPYQLTRKIRYSRHTGRVGAKLRYAGNAFACDVRALYGSQLGGEDGPTIYSARAAVDNPVEYNVTDSRYGYGRDTLTLGGGASYTLHSPSGSSTQLRGDYTTVVYRKARKETVSATLTMSF